MKIEIEELERQVIERMRMDNPWWTSGKIPDDIHQMKSRLWANSRGYSPDEKPSIPRFLLQSC